MKALKLMVSVLLVAAFCTICVFAVKSTIKHPEDWDCDYFMSESEASSVVICGNPNVRSEPLVADDYESFGENTTSYGTFANKDSSFIMYVTKVYHERKSEYNFDSLDIRNGSFVGISVSDIKQHPDWENHFPSDIVKDPDGIVWINYQYITAKS